MFLIRLELDLHLFTLLARQQTGVLFGKDTRNAALPKDPGVERLFDLRGRGPNATTPVLRTPLARPFLSVGSIQPKSPGTRSALKFDWVTFDGQIRRVEAPHLCFTVCLAHLKHAYPNELVQSILIELCYAIVTIIKVQRT